ncbi:hypothetical protein [Rhodococcus sp. NPDC055024]
MTAPDPGLTDLIAAEIKKFLINRSWGISTSETEVRAFGNGQINVTELADALTSVVEQHVNGRMAAVEAELAEAEDDKFYARVELNADMQWKVRAEKAEAAVARVENALPNIEGINPASCDYDKGWDRGQQILTEYIQSAITGDDSPAALEGEQQ